MTPELAFNDNTAAFDYACQHLDCTIANYKMLPAIVMDAGRMFGIASPVKREPDGTQVVVLQVVSDDGGFLVLSKTVGATGPALDAGDFVAWMPGTYSDALASKGPDQRFGWVGVIVGTLEPKLAQGGWVGKARFV